MRNETKHSCFLLAVRISPPRLPAASKSRTRVQLSNSLLVVAAATLLAYGSAATATDSYQEKISQFMPEQKARSDDEAHHEATRLLRTVVDDSEERVNWQSLKQAFSFSSETSVIKKNAAKFAKWNREEKMPYDIYLKWINKRYSHDEAMNWGYRFEAYQKNPAAYH
ncbi:hypothetical protein PHYSODRAFT_284720 [Phytophthora sojae]|uniref:RxLR effector protein n=2 Tax=Phytophthora sojae TaxID=67593 RepID=G4YZ21_PHYSP|nr:hypothetical protein PHYSODRAFT_284720 [Phytophthora sojae]AEK81250.1 Avh362 [Phytophthora sojae]AEK81251.1 Avh362 [Phytophthora sojae]EGZ23302.1 hypothetical protein PHYSODRAFT_284720 [Phytophthora sojae]|eukprot:XP_009518590.1 hypothetical protein PHYSODRAFT_284720 [Phytophthora sojae]